MDVAEVTSQIIGLLEEILPFEVAQQYAGPGKQCVSASAVVKGPQEGPDWYCAASSRTDVLVFDARMPPASGVIEELETRRKFCSHHKVAPFEIERRLRLIKSGRWDSWDHDGASRELPYGFKNAFLDALTHPWYGWKERLGMRKFRISDRGRFHQQEKAVDAQLVIAGCEAAADPKIDWTCLVTNDADYTPLVEHLRSRGKAVYLLSLGDPERQSRDLKNAVGTQHVIDKVGLYNGFSTEPIPEPYRSKPALITLLVHCMQTQLGSLLGGIDEETLDPVKHLEILKRYDDILR